VPETVLFERYRLIEPAGMGGSAEVWRAIDEETGDEVAVKRLHPIAVADDAARRRLRREFEALQSLDEPHIVRVRDLRFDDREAALILDFVRGETLAARLARLRAAGEAMAPETAVAVIDDIAAALAAAHAAGIVHRDVTPGNILLTADGEARLTDFGIARASADLTAVTGAGLVMGTLRYLAPEQLRDGEATPSSDLHGLAAVAYEMLAGRPAYDAATPVALVEAQEAGPAPIDGVPAAVDAVVRRGLALDPASRPADVRTFATAVGDALAQQATVAIPVGGIDRTAAIVRPVAAPVAAVEAVSAADRVEPAAAAAAATLGGGALATSSASPASRPAAREPRPRHRSRVPVPLVVGLGAVLTVALLAAASGLDRAASHGTSVRPSTPAVVAPTTRPAPSATPQPTPQPKGDKGKGNGKGKGGEGD
jgi:serine/threonine-protein kinase